MPAAPGQERLDHKAEGAAGAAGRQAGLATRMRAHACARPGAELPYAAHTTRSPALAPSARPSPAPQAFGSLLQGKPPGAVAGVLRPWCYQYGRLCADVHRGVRCEAARVLGQVVGAAGRAAAPHLRPLMGPWLVAQHDPHADTAAAARGAFQVRRGWGGGVERCCCGCCVCGCCCVAVLARPHLLVFPSSTPPLAVLLP